MAAHLLLTTLLLTATTTLAQIDDGSLPAALTTFPAHTRVFSDLSSIVAANAPLDTAISAWDATETAAFPSSVTALPESLRGGVSSAYQALASYAVTAVPPLSASASAIGSEEAVLEGSLGTTLATTGVVGTTLATSGVPSNSANGTNGGSPTSPAGGPSATQQPANAAGRVVVGGCLGAVALVVVALL